MSVIQLLDGIGPWTKRLAFVHRMVKEDKFFYAQSPMAIYLLATLVNSSYWLDGELFNEDVIQKALNDKTLNAEQKAHLYLLDIGSTLMDKGFPLNQEMLDRFCAKESPLYSYAKNFLIQCHQRNAWMKNKKVVLHKQKYPISVSKENRR